MLDNLHRLLGRHRARWNGILIEGTQPFVEATLAALDTTQGLHHWGYLRDYARCIRQRRRPGPTELDDAGILSVAEDSWRLPPIGYAAELTFLGYRRWRYSALEAGYENARVEAESTLFVVEVLDDLRTPEDLFDQMYRKIVSNTIEFLESGQRHHYEFLSHCRRKRYESRFGRLLTPPTEMHTYGPLEIWGCRRFINNTLRALNRLTRSRRYGTIIENLGVIRECFEPGSHAAYIYVDARKPRVFVKSAHGELTAPDDYATTLAHEAFHNILYRNGERYDGHDEERRCTEFEREVLQELTGKPPSTIHGIPRDANGKVVLDDAFWQRKDWRKVVARWADGEGE